MQIIFNIIIRFCNDFKFFKLYLVVSWIYDIYEYDKILMELSSDNNIMLQVKSGEIIGCTEGAVKAKVFRAIMALKHIYLKLDE